MLTKHVVCPACKATLAVPEEHVQDVVQCGKCHKRIRVFKVTASDDAVASWLNQGGDDDDDDGLEVAGGQAQAAHAAHGVPLTPRHTDRPVASPPASASHVSTHGEEFRLVKLDHSGALFEFSARRLLAQDMLA